MLSIQLYGPILDLPINNAIGSRIKHVSTEKDKERTQRHHDELVIAINAGKDELREKRKERGAAADANRKAGYSITS